MGVRKLSNKDIEELFVTYNKELEEKEFRRPFVEKRRKDRRVAINSCIDPAMDRRMHTRRKGDRK